MTDRWPNQIRAFDGTISAIERGVKRLCVTSPTGSGKCLGRGTPVLMFDGTIRAVEDVVMGDLLMGPDSLPREVTSTASGIGPLYTVTSIKGDSYIVNDAHILCLKMTNDGSRNAGRIVDISISDYMASTKTFKHCAKGWRTGVEFPDRPVPLPAYFLGIWLGDGSSKGPTIHKPDPEIEEYLKNFAQSLGMRFHKSFHKSCPAMTIGRAFGTEQQNPITRTFRELGLIENKHIPAIYKLNSRKVRAEVLAGLMDTDGHLSTGCFDFISVSKRLADDTAFVARSLGLSVSQSVCKKGCQNGFVGQYHRLSISGDFTELPIRIERKKPSPRKQKKDHLVHGIKVEPFGVGEYYGFTITGDGRFLLGDFTVTHNTTMLTDMIEWAVQNHKPVALYTQRKMLYDQTCRVLEKAGIRFGKRASGHDPNLFLDVQVCMSQTELSRVYKQEARGLHGASLVLIDELHQHQGPTFTRIVEDHVANGATVIGYTATPLDISNCDELLVAGWMSECLKIGALVRPETYAPDEPDLRHIKNYVVGRELTEGENVKSIMRPGVFARVFDAWKKHNPDARPTLGFGPDVAGSLYFAQEFWKNGVSAAHIDGEQIWCNGEFMPTDDDTRNEIARKSKQGEVKVIFNRFVLREGIDFPWLECGIFATVFGGLTSFLQSGGRLLRAYPGKEKCIINDHGGCLDDQTEILTKRGWVGIDGMLESDIIATMNQSGDCEWSKNIGTLRKWCDAPMLAHRSNFTDIRVTNYHTMVMKSDVRRGEWKMVPAHVMADRNSNCIIPTSTVERVPPSTLSDSEIGFLGWFLTDGNIEPSVPHKHRGYRNRIRIYQSGNAPALHHNHILSCLNGCGFDFSVSRKMKPTQFLEDSVQVTYSISSGRKSDRGWDRLNDWLDKNFPDIYNTLDSRQFSVLLEAMNLGDGCKAANRVDSMAIAVSNELAASRIQALAVRRGYRCNMRFQDPPKDKPWHKGVYILNLVPSSMLTVAKGSLVESPVEAFARVWCVQTNNGTIITRRNGKVAILGNSYHRHGSLAVDRNWQLGMTNQRVCAERAERLREKKEQEPITCPECQKVRASGPTCPACGFTAHKKSRLVIQIDGTLKRVDGDVYKPRVEKMKPNTQQLWERMYYRARSQKWSGTFRQAQAMFFHENHYWPPKTLRLMPKESGDFFRKVSDVPKESLIQ